MRSAGPPVVLISSPVNFADFLIGSPIAWHYTACKLRAPGGAPTPAHGGVRSPCAAQWRETRCSSPKPSQLIMTPGTCPLRSGARTPMRRWWRHSMRLWAPSRPLEARWCRCAGPYLRALNPVTDSRHPELDIRHWRHWPPRAGSGPGSQLLEGLRAWSGRPPSSALRQCRFTGNFDRLPD